MIDLDVIEETLREAYPPALYGEETLLPLIAELRAARKVVEAAATISDNRTPSDWHALSLALDELEALK